MVDWSEYVIHNFTGTDGERPNSPLVLDGRGNVYGATESSTSSGYGTVFELTPNGDGSWTESILHAFIGSWDGGYPHAIAFDRSGRLYGTTSSIPMVLPVFSGWLRFRPSTGTNWSYIHFRRRGADGDPVGILTFDAAGAIYGTTFDGGPYGSGTVFKLARDRGDPGWTETVLYTFKGRAFGGGPDGANPYDGLVFDAAGNLYGTTEWGGPPAMGTVFKLSPNPDGSWSESVLYTFKGGSDGGHPRAGLALDQAGNLFGTTAGGAGGMENPSYSYGTVFD